MVSGHMLWPVPPEFLLSAPHVTQPWEDEGENGLGEKELRDVLEGLIVDEARAMLIGRAEELAQVCGAATHWEIEPWYETSYRVERFDTAFIDEVRYIWILEDTYTYSKVLTRHGTRQMTSRSYSSHDPMISFRKICMLTNALWPR
jgi:hypothetical protein